MSREHFNGTPDELKQILSQFQNLSESPVSFSVLRGELLNEDVDNPEFKKLEKSMRESTTAWLEALFSGGTKNRALLLKYLSEASVVEIGNFLDLLTITPAPENHKKPVRTLQMLIATQFMNSLDESSSPTFMSNG